MVDSSVSDTGGRRFEPRSAQTSDFFLDRPVHIPIYRCICEIKAEKILSPERNRARSVVVESSVSDTGGRRFEPRSAQTSDFFLDRPVHIPIYRCICEIKAEKILSPERNRARSVVVESSVSDTGGRRFEPRSAQTSDFFLDRPVHIPIYRCICEIKAEKILSPERNRARSVVVESSVSDTGGRRFEPRSAQTSDFFLDRPVHIPIYRCICEIKAEKILSPERNRARSVVVESSVSDTGGRRFEPRSAQTSDFFLDRPVHIPIYRCICEIKAEKILSPERNRARSVVVESSVSDTGGRRFEPRSAQTSDFFLDRPVHIPIYRCICEIKAEKILSPERNRARSVVVDSSVSDTGGRRFEPRSAQTSDFFLDRPVHIPIYRCICEIKAEKILSPERNRARSVVVDSSVSDTGGRRFEPRSAQTSDFFLDRPVHIPIYRCICEIKAEKILSPERNRARSVVVESSVSDTGGRRFEPRSAQTSDFFLDRPVHIPIYRCICEIKAEKILSPERNRARSVVVDSSVSDTGGRRFEPRSAQTSDFFLDRPVHIPIYRCICEIKAEKILSPERNRARSVVVESSVSDTGGRRFEPRSAQTSDFFLDRPVHIPIYRCICEIKAEKILSPERNRARSVVVDSSVSDTGGRRFEPRSAQTSDFFSRPPGSHTHI